MYGHARAVFVIISKSTDIAIVNLKDEVFASSFSSNSESNTFQEPGGGAFLAQAYRILALSVQVPSSQNQ